MRVQNPTRLDAGFALARAGLDAGSVPRSYDFAQQRYQLFVPQGYDAARPWPLVVFLSPGDDPLGWPALKQICHEHHCFFCAAYGAGASNSLALRTRIVLDVFDDLRRRYRIDPDQTYLAGVTSGARLAFTLAFAFPEYCAGVLGIGAADDFHPLEYLRWRVRERLSLALLTSPVDPGLRLLRDYYQPFWTDLDIRNRLWNTKPTRTGLPSAEVLAEAMTWLIKDLPRRRADRKTAPGLVASADEMPIDRIAATRMLEAAETDLDNAERIYRSQLLLQGLISRYPATEAATQARDKIAKMEADPERKKWLAQGSLAEEKRFVTARARALERAGQLGEAQRTWGNLATRRIGTAEGTHAAREMQRLEVLREKTPYLGLMLQGDSAVVESVLGNGPAERAGLRVGDRLMQLDRDPIRSREDVRQFLQRHKPGDRLALQVQRADKIVELKLEIGRPPS